MTDKPTLQELVADYRRGLELYKHPAMPGPRNVSEELTLKNFVRLAEAVAAEVDRIDEQMQRLLNNQETIIGTLEDMDKQDG